MGCIDMEHIVGFEMGYGRTTILCLYGESMEFDM